jgi:hypothetical protein
MNNGKRPNQSDIFAAFLRISAKKVRQPNARCPRLAGISGGNGGELSARNFSGGSSDCADNSASDYAISVAAAI